MIEALDAVLGKHANLMLAAILLTDGISMVTLIIEFIYDKAVIEARYIPFLFKGRRRKHRKNQVILKMVDGQPQIKRKPRGVEVVFEQ